MIKAAIYARVSSEIQATEDKVSIDSQLKDCQTYCQERGYMVVARYIEIRAEGLGGLLGGTAFWLIF